MVAREAYRLEWHSSTMSPQIPLFKAGGSLQWNEDWGPPKARNAHKLPGSNPSSEDIPEGSHRRVGINSEPGTGDPRGPVHNTLLHI